MSGDGPHTGIVFPHAVSSSNVADPPQGNNLFGPLRSDQFGAQWVSLSDSATGLPADVYRLSADPGDPTQLFARARALMTGAIGLVPDYVAGQFDVCDRGFLNADALAATRVAQLTSSALSGWNSVLAGWDRVRAFGAQELLASPDTDQGFVASLATLYLWDEAETQLRPMRSANTNEDAVGVNSFGVLPTTSVLYGFNEFAGGSFDRIGVGSSINLLEQSANRAVLATAPGEWTLTSAPAANTTATATRAAAASVAHVLKSINATLTAVAAIAAPIGVVVRDGATGVGAILWQDRLFAAAAGTESRVSLSGLNIIGTPGNAMTVEFLAAPGATNFETLSATGTSAASAA